MAGHPIYQIYAELENYEPKIWRRFQAMENITVAKLAYILMALFEMQEGHLYVFEVNEFQNYENHIKNKIRNIEYYKSYKNKPKIAQYGCIFKDYHIPNIPNKSYRKLKDAKDVKLKNIIYEIDDKMKFKYDFGDNWNINVTLEKKFKDKEITGFELPRVIEGEGLGIVEECGGTKGLVDIREAFKTKKGAEYEMYSNWLGIKELDLSKCDLSDLNYRLKRLTKIYKNKYEFNIEPSVTATRLIERKYKQKIKRGRIKGY